MPKKTKIYIDGYNLYYGCLKHTEYKWLDIYQLFANQILKIQSPDSTVIKIKYFTADIKSKMATQGKIALHAQDSYHRALIQLYPKKIEIIKGYYSLDKANLPIYKKPPNKKDKVYVWKLEEKQTDVNIVLHAYRDAIQSRCEQIIIISNDSDLMPALKMIREDVGDNIEIGIITPIRKKIKESKVRLASVSLSQYANWTRSYILDDELKNAQLPNKIPTKKKPIIKPYYW